MGAVKKRIFLQPPLILFICQALNKYVFVVFFCVFPFLLLFIFYFGKISLREKYIIIKEVKPMWYALR